MLARSLLSLAATCLLHAAVRSQEQLECSLNKKCPESAPCCSQYGQCGVGAYCLGGCDPRMSHSIDACVPAPVCQNRKMSMNSMDRIKSQQEYLGDASTADWVYTGEPAEYGGNVILTMGPKTYGTVLSSTVYMWYGNVKAKLKTARGRGVVSAFILYSDIKDEIDYEFVGVDLETAQTNYYFQGVPKYDQSANISLSNTHDNFHEYEIQWTPDEIKWLIDGQVGRTKKRSDTWNSTTNQWDFPQTPARVQLSIWPGGDEKNAPGTIQWAGGPIDWDSDDIKQNKYYFAAFGEIEFKCFDAKNPPGTNKGTSYTYKDLRSTNDTVVDGDKRTVLKSLSGTGIDMDKAGDTGGVPNIPGGGTAGPGQNPGGEGGENGGGGAEDCSNDFSQNCSGKGPKNAAPRTGRGASGLAVVIAAVAALCL